MLRTPKATAPRSVWGPTPPEKFEIKKPEMLFLKFSMDSSFKNQFSSSVKWLPFCETGNKIVIPDFDPTTRYPFLSTRLVPRLSFC